MTTANSSLTGVVYGLVLLAIVALAGPSRASAATFGDVPESFWAYPFVETIAAHGITAGCDSGNFCPAEKVSRSQMAVFLERGIHGAGFTPPPASGTIFGDVSPSDFAAAFIEQLYADGITAGCGDGNYCPNAIVTRAQMAIFLLRAKYGQTYAPPPATGIFRDVAVGRFAAAWIEQLAADGISAGCGNGNFCPDDAVTRAQMAVFLVRTFELSSATQDTDGDGTPDLQDAFPNDPTEWVDTDGDGIGNNADTDDDNDGDPDTLEEQCGTDPLDPLSRADVNGDGQCDAMPAHLSWRVRLPGAYSLVRPAVGPDGSVYAVDVSGYLVAVSSTGSVLWSAENAGRSGVDVGPDGTVYTGSETWIKAFNPDGTLKWTFTQSPAAQIFHDVAVGPDGHVYALASSGLGVFSLEDTASGPVLRWTNPEPYVRAYVDYTELAFGPTVDGVNQQLYFNVNGHVRAIRLSDGSEVFSVSGLNQQQRPKVSPLDGTWHFGDAAYSAADGSNVWTYDFGTAATGIEPALGQSGIHYTISGGDWLFAVNPGGTGRYSTPLEESVGKPDVNLAETMLLLPTSRTFTHPSAIKAVSTSNGSPVWRLEFPPDGSGNDQHVNSSVAFSADGGAAYVMTNTSSGAVPKTTYLNAINTDPAIPSSSTLLRSANEIAVTTKLKGQSVTIDAVVTVLDENRNPVPGVAVQATWTLPDNSTVTEVVTTNNSGDAKFSYTGAFGWYSLNVTDMVKSGYAFDPRHSYLNIVRFAP